MLGFILYGLISIYILLIIIRIVFSWGMVSYTNRVMRFLVDATEPLLGPLRRMIPPLGWIDISPIVAFLILWLFQAAIAGTLLRGATIQGLLDQFELLCFVVAERWIRREFHITEFSRSSARAGWAWSILPKT